MAGKVRKRKSKGKKRLTEGMRSRLVILCGFVVIGLFAVIARLVQYQIMDTKQYKKDVLSQQQYSSVDINYRRGDILDSKGSYLATSVKIYNLVLEPKNIEEAAKYNFVYDHKETDSKEVSIDALCQYFGFTRSEVEDILSKNPNSYYYVAKSKLSYNDVKDYMDYIKTDLGKRVIGIELTEDYERSYPNGTAACQLLGYVSSGNVGNWGLEQQYSDTLNGTQGRRYSYVTDDGDVETETRDAVNGDSLITTLDLNIQNICDEQISSFMSKVGAKNVSALVMNPQNGDVLAMSNSKLFNPNDPFDEEALKQLSSDELKKLFKKTSIDELTDKEKSEAMSSIWRNYIISDTYEPGSTFKPFTMAAALEEGTVQDGDTFFCPGYKTVGDYDIRCHSYEVGGDGMVTLEQAIAKSCNVAMMDINLKLGAKKFAKYQDLFGFGQYTNIDLPGEASAENLIYTADKLGPTELATCSFGQGLNCSMIQLASGFCSLINGGNYYQPHVVKEIRNDDGGTVRTFDKEVVKKTVSKKTSSLMRRYLKSVVESGTGTGCQISGYDIGGKTGTAEKLPRNNGKYLVSFIGFAPCDDPQVLVYVTIDEVHMASQEQTSLAVQLTRNILRQVLPYLGIEKTGKEIDDDDVKNVNENHTQTVDLDQIEATASSDAAASSDADASSDASSIYNIVSSGDAGVYSQQ